MARVPSRQRRSERPRPGIVRLSRGVIGVIDPRRD
jgi:hypothetical protein